MLEWETKENQDIDFNKNQELNDMPTFKHQAVPLDKLETLDSEGNQYSIKELMQLKDLKEELDK